MFPANTYRIWIAGADDADALARLEEQASQPLAGRVLIGAQYGRMRFMRPKRASSTNMMRRRRPRRAAARLAFLTASGKPFF